MQDNLEEMLNEKPGKWDWIVIMIILALTIGFWYYIFKAITSL